jgi:hypothetical protein
MKRPPIKAKVIPPERPADLGEVAERLLQILAEERARQRREAQNDRIRNPASADPAA